jgi:hypothetical protein
MTIGADASTSTIGWVEESAWGEIPATPEFQNMRQTGNGLSPTLNKAVSDEITENSAVTDVIPTQGGAEGDVNFEPSYGASMDMMFEQTLRNVFDEYGILKGDNEYKSITFERIVNVGGTPFYFRYPGARSNSLALTFDATATSPITGTFNIMAKEEADDTAIVAGATYVAANSNPVMSMPELRAVYVEIEGVSKIACFTTLSPTINNNLRSQQGKCTTTTAYPDLTAKGEGYGRREVTLDIGYYFNDLDFVQMFKANTEGKMSYILSDGSRGYKITYPRFKIMESSVPIEGNDADVIQTMSVQALYDSTAGTDVIIEKIPNLASGAAIQFTGAPVPAGLLANFYKDGTQQNGEDVYISIDGTYGLWYDGVNYSVTDAADVGVGAVEYFFIAGTNPVGSYTVGADGSGTLTGAAYDPTA